MTDYQLHQGDCLEIMPTLEKGSVAMVFADLPYGATKNSWDCPGNFDMAKFWAATALVGRQRCINVLSATNPFAADIIASNRQQFRYDLVWRKSRATNFLNAKGQPLRAHELLCCFYAKPPTYNAQKTATSKGRGRLARMRGSLGSNYHPPMKTTTPWQCDGTRHPTSIITAPSESGRQQSHPTQKPVALLEWLVATYTNPGDLVLDPCFGSNTTGIACMRLGRKYIGIERDKTYFEAGKRRIEAECERLAAQSKQGNLTL